MRLLLVALGMLLAGAPARACDRATLRAALDGCFEAWRDRDQVAFRAAREAAGQSLVCQSELLPRDVVRDLHVTAALSAYLPPRDEEAVSQGFRAALAADPGFALDADLAPQGNLLQTLLEGARTAGPGLSEDLRAEDGCVVLVDGREGEGRPLDRPTVLQESCPDRVGAVALLPPGAPLPRWASVPVPEPVAPERPVDDAPVATAEPVAASGPRWSTWLAAGGGAALVASGGLVLGARLE
jgi:hypothetical protein